MRASTVPLALVLLSAAALAQVPDAGPDQALVFPAAAALSGTVTGGTPLEFWTADGNGVFENYAIRYSSVSGTISVGPLRTASNQIYGFPADLVRIGASIYGVDATRRQIYTVNLASGIVTPIGSPWTTSYPAVESLAHDPALDRLYAVDQSSRQLLLVNRVTGVPTPIGTLTLTAWPQVRSLAWNAADSNLYAVDQASDALLRIAPATGIPTFVATLAADPDARIEELVFQGGDLYAMNSFLTSGTLTSAELQRIDLPGGAAHLLGPEIPDVSAHSLIVDSVPEPILWSAVSGPGSVGFGDPESHATTATFSAPGAYVLRLTVETISGPVSDDVTIVEDGCPSDPNKIEPGICGCGVADVDTDADLVLDCDDNCPSLDNSDQFDSDFDGVGDACDNCITIANPGQADCDADLDGDVCEIAGGEPDCNGNAVPDGCDLTSGVSADANANQVPDECESPSGAPYCFGDGSGTACPCGNSVPPGTPSGCRNSTGFGGALAGSGSAQVSADTFVLGASGAPPNVLGVIFQGRANAAGGAGVLFADGLRCVQTNLLRIAAISASPTGNFTYPLVGNPSISVRGQLPPTGGLRYYQITYRNNIGPCLQHLNLTNGVAVSWVP